MRPCLLCGEPVELDPGFPPIRVVCQTCLPEVRGCGHYGLEGEPVSFWEWAGLMASGEQWVLYTGVVEPADHDDDRATYVSTIWLGLDLAADLLGRTPLIYETMIFGGPHDQRQWRYPTRGAAVAGHDQAVALARDAAGARR
jgi:hypothetical protein